MTVHTTRLAMIAKGMSRLGLRVSSAAVLTASNPIYAKKMIAAAEKMPSVPLGAKGCQLDLSMKKAPKITKNAMMASFSMTMLVLNHALSRMPITSTHVINTTMAAAGTLNRMGMPNRCGACAKAAAALITASPRTLGSPPAATWCAACAALR